jgi:fucose-1-phosphate guanylyltransferase
VFSDPPGAKLGDGGATLHVLDQLVITESEEYIKNSKVLLIHAGGYSQRLPSASVIGKVFAAYPINGEVYQMFDLLLIMLIEFTTRMKPGVYVCCSDVLLPSMLSGNWTFIEPGFTGIAIPCEAQVGTTHGVYVLEDPSGLKKQYEQEPDKTAFMCKFKKFVHKMSLEELQRQGAVIPGTNTLYIDHSYFIDCGIVEKLLQFYRKFQPLKCEVDAYGDFLRPLGSDATLERILDISRNSSQDLCYIRKELFHILHQEPARVVAMQQASFVHFGTIKEYLSHFCESEFLRTACLFTEEALVKHVGSTADEDDVVDGPPRKVTRKDAIPTSVVMLTVKDRRSSVAVGSVVEFSTLEGNSKVETSCIVSGIHLTSGLIVPSHSYLHTVAIEMDNGVKFVTFALGVDDNIKAKCSLDDAHTLPYYGTTIEKAIQKLSLQGIEDLWPKETAECSLWNVRLFAVCDTRPESAEVSIEVLRLMRGYSVDCSIIGGLPCHVTYVAMVICEWLSVTVDHATCYSKATRVESVTTRTFESFNSSVLFDCMYTILLCCFYEFSVSLGIRYTGTPLFQPVPSNVQRSSPERISVFVCIHGICFFSSEKYRMKKKVSLQEMTKKSSSTETLAFVDHMFKACRSQH